MIASIPLIVAQFTAVSILTSVFLAKNRLMTPVISTLNVIQDAAVLVIAQTLWIAILHAQLILIAIPLGPAVVRDIARAMLFAKGIKQQETHAI